MSENGDLLVLDLFDVLSFSSIFKPKQGKLNKVYMYDFTKENKSKLISFYIVIIESGLRHLIFTTVLEFICLITQVTFYIVVLYILVVSLS